MSFFGFNFAVCSNTLFKSTDFNDNLITYDKFKEHDNIDNAWILINNKVYSIQKNDDFLLNLFSKYYAKDASNFLKSLKDDEKNIVLNKLNDRFIGKIKEN